MARSSGRLESRDWGGVVGAGGWGVRFLSQAWRGLIAAAIFVGLCAVFGEDKPEPDSRDDGKVSLDGDFGLVGTINFSSDGETLLASSWDKTVRIWDVRGLWDEFGEELARLPVLSEIYDVAMSPDCRTVATAGVAGLTLWNWRDGGATAETIADLGASRALAFSPDGGSLAVGGSDGEVRLLDLRSRRVAPLFGDPGEAIRKLWITSDGSLLISLSYTGGLIFWDLERERMVEKIDGPTSDVLAACPSPDGKSIAISRYWKTPGEIEIWDLETGRLKARGWGHDGITQALAFSRDGGTLASAGSDLRIRLWDANTGRAVGEVDEVGEWVRVLKFSIDDRWLAYAGARDRVRLKRINPPGLATRAAPPSKSVESAAHSPVREATDAAPGGRMEG